MPRQNAFHQAMRKRQQGVNVTRLGLGWELEEADKPELVSVESPMELTLLDPDEEKS